MTHVSPSTVARFRRMSSGERNTAVAKVLLGKPTPDLEREVLAYRAALVTALREQDLWPYRARERR